MHQEQTKQQKATFEVIKELRELNLESKEERTEEVDGEDQSSQQAQDGDEDEGTSQSVKVQVIEEAKCQCADSKDQYLEMRRRFIAGDWHSEFNDKDPK